jgi:peptidoglycan/LPS O-acetylase OafA/YrhL
MLLDAPHYFYTQRYIVHGSLWQTIGGFLATAGLVQAWLNLCSLNPPGWSLSTETFFYIVFPFLGLALWKMRGWAAWGASVLIYAAGLGLVVALDQIQGRDQQPYYPLPYLFVFALGILLAKLFVWIGQSPARSERLESSAPWLLIGSVAGVLAIPLTSIGRHESLLLHGLLAPVFAVAILAFASGNRRIARMFEARWLVVLGEASYGLYLLHIPIHSILRHTIERFGLPMVVLYYVGTIGLSVASYFLLEVPARRWILAKEQVRSVETEVTAALSQ